MTATVEEERAAWMGLQRARSAYELTLDRDNIGEIARMFRVFTEAVIVYAAPVGAATRHIDIWPPVTSRYKHPVTFRAGHPLRGYVGSRAE